MSTKKSPSVTFNDPTPEGAVYRGEQAMIDADIECLARDARVDAFMEELREAGVPTEESIQRMVAFVKDLDLEAPSAAAE